MDLCLQGSGDLRICGSQMNWNIAKILVFLDFILMPYQVFGVNFMWHVCC